MKSQRGVTLIELLVIIVIMGAIFVPISMMVIYSLEKEQEVTAKNEVQREARIIMEYMTEKMRNKNVVWIKEETQWKLCKSSDGSTCISPNIYLIYEPNTNSALGLSTMKMGTENVLSSHVIFDPEVASQGDSSTIELTIDKTEDIGESINLKSEIYYDRFNIVNSGEGTEVPLEEDEDISNENVDKSCPPDQYKNGSGKCQKCPPPKLQDGVCTFK